MDAVCKSITEREPQEMWKCGVQKLMEVNMSATVNLTVPQQVTSDNEPPTYQEATAGNAMI